MQSAKGLLASSSQDAIGDFMLNHISTSLLFPQIASNKNYTKKKSF